MAWPASWPHAGAMNETTANPEASSPTTTSPEASSLTRPQPLCRPIQDRMLAGVAAGIARYLGVDATIVRIVFAVLVVTGGIGVPIYLAGWLLIPEEGCEQSIAGALIQSLQPRSHRPRRPGPGGRPTCQPQAVRHGPVVSPCAAAPVTPALDCGFPTPSAPMSLTGCPSTTATGDLIRPSSTNASTGR